MKLFNFLLFVMLFVYPNQQKEEPLFKGIYTETGYGHSEQNEALNSGFVQSYYVEIYKNKLVVTTTEFGTGKTIELEYKFSKKDAEGNSIYVKDQMNAYRVDSSFDIEKVNSFPDSRYGNKVWNKSYWQVVKGDRATEYYQKHKDDGSSWEDRYKKESQYPFPNDDNYGF